MGDTDYAELLERVQKQDFPCSLLIYELSLHGENIGVQHYLVQRLSRYHYSELEFFVPQLIQLIVSFESDSMALHDLVLDLSRRYPHFCILSFWNLQAFIHELKNEPGSYSFHVVRNFINSIQNIMFNQDSTCDKPQKMRENIYPAIVMSASIVSSIIFPKLNEYSKPLIQSQGRQEKSFLFKLANFHKTLTKNLTLKNRGTSSTRDLEDDQDHKTSDRPDKPQRFSESMMVSERRFSRSSDTYSSDVDDTSYNSDYTQDHSRLIHSRTLKKKHLYSGGEGNYHSRKLGLFVEPNRLASHSMPELVKNSRDSSLDVISPSMSNSSSLSLTSENKIHKLTDALKSEYINLSSKLLQVNYFKKETEFMMILQNISTRLSMVPKEARLSSLRAELSIINNTRLPSQIDIPQLLPASSKPNRKYHRILKLNVNEACVLNSAERVPYLLLIEYLSEDMDFDPLTDRNKNMLNDDGSLRKETDAEPFGNTESILGDSSPYLNKYDEADLGDISVVALFNEQSHYSHHLKARLSEKFGPAKQKLSDVKGVPLETNYLENEEDQKEALEAFVSSVSTKNLSTQVRIAALMLRQLEKSGQSNLTQSAAIRNRIVNSMKTLQDKFETIDYQQIKEMSAVHGQVSEQDAGERKLENDFKIGEDWATKRARIRRTSAFGHLPNWDLCSVIVKNGDDLQQEAFACQLISMMSHIWKFSDVPVWTKTMKIIVTSYNSGLVETINNALSVHSIKKTLTELSLKNSENPKGAIASLKDYFLKVYGDEKSPRFLRAQENFARSLAAYSIICYILQIKDRHNGNIMLDNEGHIIHIDFGFILSNSPGSVGFEAAPFKLTAEYVDLLGGVSSPQFSLFKSLCKKSFLALRKNADQIVNLVDMMQKDSSLPCFKNGPQTSVLLRQRFHLEFSDEECEDFVESALIGKSIGSMYTRLYDQFQLLTQGIYS